MAAEQARPPAPRAGTFDPYRFGAARHGRGPSLADETGVAHIGRRGRRIARVYLFRSENRSDALEEAVRQRAPHVDWLITGVYGYTGYTGYTAGGRTGKASEYAIIIFSLPN